MLRRTTDSNEVQTRTTVTNQFFVLGHEPILVAVASKGIISLQMLEDLQNKLTFAHCSAAIGFELPLSYLAIEQQQVMAEIETQVRDFCPSP
jgi:hypothetical protein